MEKFAFRSVEDYLECFKDIQDIHISMDEQFKAIYSEIEEKCRHLLISEPKKQDGFLIPELPKLKKDVKHEPSRASRRKQSELNKTSIIQRDVTITQNDNESIRRSSRIASKTKLKPSIAGLHNSNRAETGNPNNTFLVSPSHPPNKMRKTSEEIRKNITDTEPNLRLEESVCTADMKQPLGSSTPTSPPQTRKSSDKNDKMSDEENKTPTNVTRTLKGSESVKKRIEEFEKRAKGQLPPSRLPVKTPEKNKVVTTLKNTSKINGAKGEVFTDDDSSVTETRALRTNSKIPQEKNANVKLSKEKAIEAQKKKAAMMKASIEEKMRKREERGQKAAAQRAAAEKEKLQAAMKLEKEKEEKFKSNQKTKDEKYKAEYEKKKKLAAMKAAEMEERRKQEDLARIAKLKKAQLALHQAMENEVPEYNIDDVVEGDSSEDEDNPKKTIPSWATKKMREYPLNVQSWLNKKKTVYPWFYNKNLKHPKLEELFSREVKTRPRTSSAFWNSRICFNESFPLV